MYKIQSERRAQAKSDGGGGARANKCAMWHLKLLGDKRCKSHLSDSVGYKYCLAPLVLSLTIQLFSLFPL